MHCEELIARRTALGLSQRDLANLIDAKQATVAHWERGARPIPGDIDTTLAGIEHLEETFAKELVEPWRENPRQKVTINLPLTIGENLPMGLQRVIAATALRKIRGNQGRANIVGG